MFHPGDGCLLGGHQLHPLCVKHFVIEKGGGKKEQRVHKQHSVIKYLRLEFPAERGRRGVREALAVPRTCRGDGWAPAARAHSLYTNPFQKIY